LLLSNIFEYIYNTISYLVIVKFVANNYISKSINLLLFFVIKNYLLQLDLKLSKVFSNNSILEVCYNIKNINKIVKKIEILQNFFC